LIPGPIISDEGRKPNPQFDPAWYRATYPDVVAAKVEPFQHFLTYGPWKAACSPRKPVT